MQFEFDLAKSASNQQKHGIDFVRAQVLWHSPRVEVGAKDRGEKRYLVIGLIAGENWSAIVTYLGMTIRIISVRRSTPSEIAFYAKTIR